MAEMRENLVRQREQMEDALLEQMLAEEKAMLDRLAGVERNLRNMIRLYKQLMDERNAMVSGIEQLHSWLRQLELKQGKKPHREHGPDLTQKFLVEYLSKQAWIFDNQGGWGVEEVPQQPRGTAVSR